MQASPARLRGQALARRCASLKADGLTTRRIAAETGVRAEKVKTLVEIGQRLLAMGVK
jgi:DNA-binding CsgD family transcriptional regulator